MLTTEERVQVEKELARALSDSDSPRKRIRDVFPDATEYNAILLKAGTADLWPLARIALDECLLSRWTRTPPMLGTLLSYLVDVRGIGGMRLPRPSSSGFVPGGRRER